MASPQEVAVMQQQLQSLQEQTAVLNEGLRRAGQAHNETLRRLGEAEAALAEARAPHNSPFREERSLTHPSNVPKPPIYNGKKEEWEKFKHIYVAWSSTVHARFPELLEKFGSAKDPVDELTLSPEDDRLAKALHTFLMQYCPEPTMNVIGQGMHDANGFEVWRRLVQLSEPAHRTKAWVWRKHLSNPSFPTDIAMWSSALHQWESELREYERMFKTPFSEDEKISILAHVSPKELQQSIVMHSDALDTYFKIREYIEHYLVNKNLWKRPQGCQFGLTKFTNKREGDDQRPAPMDIGGIKGKDGKGKGKNEGKNDQRGKGDKSWKWQDKLEKVKEKASRRKEKEAMTKEKEKESHRTTKVLASPVRQVIQMLESSAMFARNLATLRSSGECRDWQRSACVFDWRIQQRWSSSRLAAIPQLDDFSQLGFTHFGSE